MRQCQACFREFTGRRADCPHCGFNNAPKGGPRSVRSLAAMEQQRMEAAEFERELAELTGEFAAWLGWPAEAEPTPQEGIPP